ncbi:MAG: ABC transporter permease [Actinobacteria bacterium]|nr:ABC transporter permease [Actinomycetota bacterium]
MKTFLALLQRDVTVLIRDLPEFVMRIAMQPFLFVFVFGYVLPSIGQVKSSYANLLLPGILAASMMMAGVQGTAIPLSQDFGAIKEIEDRLMAPIRVSMVVLEKIVMGTLQAWIAGGLVFPLAWAIMRSNLSLHVTSFGYLFLYLFLVGLASAATGITLGTIISPFKIPLMFATIIIPMIFLGATYYPWHALSNVVWLQTIILINPMVYAAEGFRSVLTPGIPHIRMLFTILGLFGAVIILSGIGLRGFIKRAYS